MVHRRRKPEENAAQGEKAHLWMETSEGVTTAGQIKNLILLGTDVGITDAIPPDLIKGELVSKFGAKGAV